MWFVMSDIVITQSDKGKTFNVIEGDSISIQLSENPTTGYRWELQAFNEEVIELRDSHFSLNAGAGIGGGGKRTFNFKTRALGTSKIYLRLRREWEPEKRVIDQFEVIIQATKKGD